MKTTLRILVLLALTFTVSFAQTEEEQLRSFIDSMYIHYEKMMENNDFTEGIKYYADDAYSLPSYQPMIHGRENLMAHAEKQKESGVKINSMNFDTKEVFVSGNFGYEIGTFQMEVEIPGMEEPYNENGKYINIYEKQEDGSWKIKADIWNSDKNPSQTEM